MENYIGIEFMDREGDRAKIYGFDVESERYLGRFTTSTHTFADILLSKSELEEELKDQAIREKFYKYCVTL